MPTTNGDQAVQIQKYDCYRRGTDSPSHRFVVVSRNRMLPGWKSRSSV